jgi:hypothetical protein
MSACECPATRGAVPPSRPSIGHPDTSPIANGDPPRTSVGTSRENVMTDPRDTGSRDPSDLSFPASDPPASSGQGAIGGPGSTGRVARDDHQPLSVTRADRMAVLGIPDWSEYLRSLPGIATDGRASALLLRDEPVRVLLSALNARAEIGSEGAEEAVLVQVLRGAVEIDRDGQREPVYEQEIVAIPPGGGWHLRAQQDGTILLSTFWDAQGGVTEAGDPAAVQRLRR